ncbi:MAG: DNA-processing protein DprA [Acutalibacteraceae bacterium]
MNDALYWLWLQKSLGYGANISYLVRYFGSARGIYEAGEDAWRKSGLFGTNLLDISSSKIDSMRSTSLHSGEKIIEQCERDGIRIVTPQDKDYPTLLLRTENYPAVLFVKGEISCVNEMTPVAVVGTRRPSEYGREAAKRIAEGLVKADVAVISGGALGVDSIAHTAAVENKGKTVMVMGCGHGYDYLKENEALREAVSENGAVISEYPPKTASSLFHFPMRNRIISGISRGVAIIEAGEKSGTLNTARHAKQQNRQIFVVPGDISSVSFSGSNRLILEGAKAIFGAKDILSYYSLYDKAIVEIEKTAENEPFYGIGEFAVEPESKSKKKSEAKNKTAKKYNKEKEEKNEQNVHTTKRELSGDVSENAKQVYTLLSEGKTELDELARDSGLDVSALLIALTELEMEGAAVSLGGNRYSLADR